jgi:enolase
LLVLAVENCGHTGKIKFAIDPASSEFFDSGKYNLGYKDKSSEEFSPEQLAKLYNHLIDEYPIVLLEDPFAQDDWDSWSMFNTSCKIELVGDDLLATNAERIKLASDKKACNSLLLRSIR